MEGVVSVEEEDRAASPLQMRGGSTNRRHQRGQDSNRIPSLQLVDTGRRNFWRKTHAPSLGAAAASAALSGLTTFQAESVSLSTRFLLILVVYLFFLAAV
ncbi:hypothetical protein MRX96_047997 [Rhipicephalus microplus]